MQRNKRVRAAGHPSPFSLTHHPVGALSLASFTKGWDSTPFAAPNLILVITKDSASTLRHVSEHETEVIKGKRYYHGNEDEAP
jgi:acid phosphatase family membrane protein YuiD